MARQKELPAERNDLGPAHGQPRVVARQSRVIRAELDQALEEKLDNLLFDVRGGPGRRHESRRITRYANAQNRVRLNRLQLDVAQSGQAGIGLRYLLEHFFLFSRVGFLLRTLEEVIRLF